MESNVPKYGISALIFVLSYIYHGLGVLFMILVLLSCFDYITGIIAGAIKGNLSSRLSLYGIFRKVGLLLLVPVSVAIDYVLQDSGYITTPIMYHAVTSWLIATEAISIIENVTKMGAPVPPIFHHILQIMGSSHHGGHEVPKQKTNRKRRKSE